MREKKNIYKKMTKTENKRKAPKFVLNFLAVGKVYTQKQSPWNRRKQKKGGKNGKWYHEIVDTKNKHVWEIMSWEVKERGVRDVSDGGEKTENLSAIWHSSTWKWKHYLDIFVEL